MNNKKKTLLVVIVLIVALGLIRLIVFNPTNNSTNNTSPQYVEERSNNKSYSFNIEDFYNGIENNMSTQEVNDLAKSTLANCSYTDAIPPSVSCTWQDGSKSVYVNFGNRNLVISKSKSGF